MVIEKKNGIYFWRASLKTAFRWRAPFLFARGLLLFVRSEHLLNAVDYANTLVLVLPHWKRKTEKDDITSPGTYRTLVYSALYKYICFSILLGYLPVGIKLRIHFILRECGTVQECCQCFAISIPTASADLPSILPGKIIALYCYMIDK